MSTTEKVVNVICTISEWSGKIVAPLVLLIAIVVGYDVILRYVFNIPTDWAVELSSYLCGIYFVMGGAYALRHKLHVNVDIVYGRLSPRGRAILDLITSVGFFLFVGVLLWQGYRIAEKALVLGQTSSTLWRPPLFPFRVWWPIGAFLILLQGLAWFVDNLFIAIRGKGLIEFERKGLVEH